MSPVHLQSRAGQLFLALVFFTLAKIQAVGPASPCYTCLMVNSWHVLSAIGQGLPLGKLVVPSGLESPASGTSGTGFDPVAFARLRLGFHPDPSQESILRSTAKGGILNCSRQWGKSMVGAAMAVIRAHTRPASLVLVAAPTERQSGELVRTAESMVLNMGLDPRGDGANKISIAFDNGSRIVGLPGQLNGNAGGIRGFAVSLLLIDEAAYLDDSVYHALTPMLGATNGDLWLMSTPNGKRGFFYEAWAFGTGWEKVKGPATECPRIQPEFLERQREIMGPVRFEQEFLCEFNESDNAMFADVLLERAMDSTIPPLAL